MLLYLVRHGEPNYALDILTEKGEKQAELAAQSLENRGITRIFSSPDGRARLTAKPLCDRLELPCGIEPWASENRHYDEISVTTGDGRTGWVYEVLPRSALCAQSLRDRGDKWYEDPLFAGVPVKATAERIANGFDDLMNRLHYRREGPYYIQEEENPETVALFCHHGVGTTVLAHLFGVPVPIFWTSFRMPHTAVTRIRFEADAEGIVVPVCESLSNASHLEGKV